MTDVLKPWDTPLPAIALRPRPSDKQKTIVISGAPRGGTTFGASVVANLGIPFSEKPAPGEANKIGMRYSHPELMGPFVSDRNTFGETCRLLDREHDVWALKLPSLTTDAAFAMATIRNPHFIFIFKEALSVASRSLLLKGVEASKIASATRNVIRHYEKMLDFIQSSEAPMLLISYERAMADLPVTIRQTAEFLGIENADVPSACDGIAMDRHHYFALSEHQAFHRERGLGRFAKT